MIALVCGFVKYCLVCRVFAENVLRNIHMRLQQVVEITMFNVLLQS